MKGNDKKSGVFDFFISYKQKDSKDFAKYLLDSLHDGGAEVWLDQVEMNLGDFILEGIENGIKSSIDSILILSENYFTGWSKQERDNLFSLMVSGKTRVVPIWYKLSLDDIESLSPMLSGLVSAKVENGDREDALEVSSKVLNKFNPKQREMRLYELFFQAVRKHVEDPDLDIFLAVFRNDTKLLEAALEQGGNPDITDVSLWNRYNKIITDHKDVWPSWRKLFLHLSSTGKIGSE